MKKFYLVLIFIAYLSAFGANAQELELDNYEIIKDKKGFDDFVGQDENGFFTLRRKKSVYYLIKYNKDDLNVIFEKPVVWENVNDDSVRYRKFYVLKQFKNNFIVFYNAFDNFQKPGLYAQKVDFNGNLIGSIIKVDERIKGDAFNPNVFQIIHSEDSLNFLVFIKPYDDKIKTTQFTYKIINSDLELLFKKNISLQGVYAPYFIESALLTSANIIYINTKTELPTETKRQVDVKYEIFKIDPLNQLRVQSINIVLEDKYINQAAIYLDKNEKIKCIGVYTNLKEKVHGIITGTFSIDVDEELKSFDKISFMIFNDSFKRNGVKELEKFLSFSPPLKVKNIFDKEDGGTLILLERSFISSIYTKSYKAISFHDSNILAINIDPKGNIIWNMVIPKEQLCTGTENFGSFYATKIKDTTYIIYNDDKRNAVSKNFKHTMMEPHLSDPVLVLLKEDGSFEKYSFAFEFVKSNLVFNPSSGIRFKKNEAIIFSHHVKPMTYRVSSTSYTKVKF